MKQKPSHSLDLIAAPQDASHQSNTRKPAPVTSLASVKTECKDLYGAEALAFYFYYAQLLSAANDKTMVFLPEAV